MIQAGVGLSSRKDAVAAAQEAAERALAQAGTNGADFALTFFTAHYYEEIEAALEGLRLRLGTDCVAGCSGSGVLTHEREIENGPGFAVLAVKSDEVRARPIWVDHAHQHPESFGEEVARQLGEDLDRATTLILLADAMQVNPRVMLDSLRRHVGEVPAVGGGASVDLVRETTMQVCRDKVGNNAVSGLALIGARRALGVTHACLPIGEPLIVEEARGNALLNLGGVSALDALFEQIGTDSLEDLRPLMGSLFVALPVDGDNPGFGPDQYYIRPFLGVDPSSGAVIVAEEVRPGLPIKIAVREAGRARSDMRRMLGDVRRTMNGGARFGLYVNCCGRGMSLYGVPEIDLCYLREEVGNIPLIGFTSFAEIGPSGRHCVWHNYTGVLALIGDQGG